MQAPQVVMARFQSSLFQLTPKEPARLLCPSPVGFVAACQKQPEQALNPSNIVVKKIHAVELAAKDESRKEGSVT
jgi:hypothetical protein